MVLHMHGVNFEKLCQDEKNAILSHYDPKIPKFEPFGLVDTTLFFQTKDPGSIPTLAILLPLLFLLFYCSTVLSDPLGTLIANL